MNYFLLVRETEGGAFSRLFCWALWVESECSAIRRVSAQPSTSKFFPLFASMDSESDVSLRQILETVQSQALSINDLKSQVTSELSELKQEVHGSSAQVKKFKSDALVKWRSEGHRIQFVFNSEVAEELTQITWAIDNNKIDYAKEVISSLSDKVKRRNKLIKIADTSEGGWDTVRNYESNPVASDSEDESRINRAENRALKKRKLAKQKQSKSSNAATSATAPSPGMQLFRAPQFLSSQRFGSAQAASRGTGRNGGFGACFACGSFSHWRNECPFNFSAKSSSGSATATKPKSD
ncbi:hypothetical protein FSP39_001115 [Pinctada imbricata]|uniref:CCHC-type domain-containing protein n=1 Tax=Pinctada imbricata TaxID=66713 RepID=A0AA89BUI6_PINIB|nr:hypothetical protein FSP39_001115 [Pinctada imbricata]